MNLVDANVLLYSVDRDVPAHQASTTGGLCLPSNLWVDDSVVQLNRQSVGGR